MVGYSNSGYDMPSQYDLINGPAGMAQPANSGYNMDMGMGAVPLSFALDYGSGKNQGGYMNAGLGVNVNPSAPSMFSTSGGGGIGSVRPMTNPRTGGANAGGLPDWMNWGNAGNLMQGIGALGSVWAGIQQNKLAKEALNFKKKSYSENMDFQKQSYNTALEDRVRSRSSFTGAGEGYVSSYLDKNKL